MPNTSIKITTYNIHKGMSPLNRAVIMQRMAIALRRLNPDIICMQEVQGKQTTRAIELDDFPSQPHHEWFASELGFNATYKQNCTYKDGHHGNAILSHFSIEFVHNLDITVNRIETRGILHCELNVHGTKIAVLSAHLNLLEIDRRKQFKIMREYITDAIDKDQPLILGGDLNDWLRMSDKKLGNKLGLTEAVVDTKGRFIRTFPAVFPVLSLDRIYVRNLQIKRGFVNTGRPWNWLSDHLPVTAELIL